MNAVCLDESKTALLDQQLAGGLFAGSNLKMMLGGVLSAIAHTDVLATFTAQEMSFSGYSRQTVTGWSAAALTTDKHARADADTVLFHNGSGSPSPTITFWALVDTAAGKAVQAGLFTTPFSIPDGEDWPIDPFWLQTGDIASEP